MPNTIAQNLARLVAAKASIANAIVAKGGTVGANDGLEDFSNDIATIPSGGGVVVNPSDVNFYDYDGTLVYSYTAAEFAQLSALPANPSHAGLTAQGWNWSLSDAKTYVADYGKLNVGQMYATSDGATRLHIHLKDGRLSPVLGLCPKGTLTIDWGDGSATETMTGSNTYTLKYLPHTYAQAGKYTISIMPSSGSTFGFNYRTSSSTSASTVLCKNSSDSVDERRIYLSAITSVNIGSGITNIDNYAFSFCYSLTSVTIPSSVISIGSDAFYYCGSLTLVTIPSSVTSIGFAAFMSCSSLTLITIPNSIASISTSIFQSSPAIASVTIPNSVTDIANTMFRFCYSLASVTIPSSVTSIGSNAFQGCYGLGFIRFKGTTPPTVSSSTTFSTTSSDCIIYVPALVLNLYMDGTNYPSKSTYNYIGYATYESDITLPDKTTDETYTLTWYSTVSDAIAEINPITVGNGSEIYARATAI